MSLSGLSDPARTPVSGDLAALLGPSLERWQHLIERVARAHAPLREVWHFGGARNGWILRLKRRERVVLYMIPQLAGFLVAMVLGDRAFARANALELPDAVLELMRSAPRHIEGRGFRLSVRGDEDVDVVVRLAAAKMAR